MAIPTVQNVYDAARGLLGDDAISGGQLFTNTVLQPHYTMAFRELWRVMASVGTPRVLREAYWLLPAHTSYLDPATAGITDMGDPEFVQEREAGTSVAITGITAGTSPTVTAAGHPFATGDYAVISGAITGLAGANGQFAVTVSSSSAFVLNGAVTAGTWTAGGTAYKTSASWNDVLPQTQISEPTVESGMIYRYAWIGDVFQFMPCSSDRQLKITYWSSGAAPTSPTSYSIGIDDSQDYLATRTAGLAAESRGAKDRGMALNVAAIGSQLKADGNDGMLGQFLGQQVRNMQKQRWIRPAYGRHPNKDYMVFPG